MYNLVLSPIDPEKLITDISERVTANILKAVQNNNQTTEQPEKFLTIQEASKFLNLTVPTLYSKVSKCEVPSFKQGNRLYFSSVELTEYLKQGKKKTYAEIEAEAENYLFNNKKGL
ncbi:helix-turn-helix domain-containing protein [Myroides marinus]|uniref:helix-turn-helix domain-containing protein n=1 Tax=Myroides marinus TaxID=703342 RepID=UPI002577D3A8|nr:helix-turn-helix domain-containing protein [Myroides marinus]MDM1534221.1 helix-turn-helix domain-containing protein [Myroides marinus]MDM1541185.1 helix-turn-helix domain-containing protein [Myroides marinus]